MAKDTQADRERAIRASAIQAACSAYGGQMDFLAVNDAVAKDIFTFAEEIEQYIRNGCIEKRK